MEATFVWNTVLTLLIGVVGFFMSSKFKELDRISILLNKTREEVARDHITRTEFRQDMKELIERFDRIEAKIDNLKGRQGAVQI